MKRHKRLWIEDDEGMLVYTPPNFIGLQSREPMHELARELERRPYIEAVMDFEERVRR